MHEFPSKYGPLLLRSAWSGARSEAVSNVLCGDDL